MGRVKTNSVKEQRCEFCFAPVDLEEARIGPQGKGARVLLVCADQKACRSRWPATWPPGTVGVPLDQIEGGSDAR